MGRVTGVGGGVMAPRTETLPGRLARLGFSDVERAVRLVTDGEVRRLLDPLDDLFDDGLLVAVGATPDPDLALLGLTHLLEGLRAGDGDRDREQDPAAAGRLRATLRGRGEVARRLLVTLGSSAALGEHLARHPEHWLAVAEDVDRPHHPEYVSDHAATVRRDLLAAVGVDPVDAADSADSADGVDTVDTVDAGTPGAVAGLAGAEGADALRVAYRRHLVAIAARDLSADDPLVAVPEVAQALADLAAAALEAGLAVARADLPDRGAGVRLAVIGMGKCGGRELNYVSDVDVVHVVAAADGASEAHAVEVGARLAAGLARVCSASTPEGTLWPVDANLRPEGRNGPLVRTVASHRAYYQRWAKTWEFQALLKARPVAGDRALGQEYASAVMPLVWEATARENFVDDVRAMRRRVETHVPAKDGDRELKLGRGGLRDVEFAVQLLQLVHGRTDERLRTGHTLAGLEALSAFGYVARRDAGRLDTAYRFLRALEHRIQLYRLRRTHVLPDDVADLRRLGRSMGLTGGAASELVRACRDHQREVRRLHEKLFYRPLLSASARLSADDARLSPGAARDRLEALGYSDPTGALRHLEALTSGVSRRAAIQRTLLPVLLGWFADGADPDAGLLAFRRVSETLGSTHWYLRQLRDSGAAAERLAHVLSSGRLAADYLEQAPESVALLDDVAPRPPEVLRGEVLAAVDRHLEAGSFESAALAGRAVRRRELTRTAIADVVGAIELDGVGQALAGVTDLALEASLRAATAAVRRYREVPTRLLVVGMGRLGGCESGYSSDADVLLVHDPLPGADESDAQDAAVAVVVEMRRLLSPVVGGEPGVELDSGLRPEGRSGPLVRSLASYRAYYRRWAHVWEAQALLRARPVAGDAGVGAAFLELVDPVRYPPAGLSDAGVREVRRIKARVESERLPRGVDGRRHLKLGPGGVSDVEWTVQLLQLRHAANVRELRVTGTRAALAAAAGAGLLDAGSAAQLDAAWLLASRVRNAITLWRGRGGDVLPSAARDLEGIARCLGYPAGSGGEVEEEYLRLTRRCRAVVEGVFYA